MTEPMPQPPTHPEAPNHPAPALIIFLLIPLIGILVALFMLLAEGDTSPGQLNADYPRNTLVNQPAPNFELSTIFGEPITLADYAGRPLFINFWQTTCAPCVRELPAFAEFSAAQGETGAAVLTINFEETSAQVFQFFETNDISGITVALDPDSMVRRTYGVAQIPTTYVVSADGEVRFVQIGELTVDQMEAYLAQLTEVAVNNP